MFADVLTASVLPFVLGVQRDWAGCNQYFMKWHRNPMIS